MAPSLRGLSAQLTGGVSLLLRHSLRHGIRRATSLKEGGKVSGLEESASLPPVAARCFGSAGETDPSTPFDRSG